MPRNSTKKKNSSKTNGQRSNGSKNRDRASVADALSAYCKRHGPLQWTGLEKYDPGLAQAAYARYGSLRNAARKVGLPFKPRHCDWSAKSVIAEVRRRHKQGLSLQAARVAEEQRNLYNAGLRYYDSWRNVLEACGINYDRIAAVRSRDLPNLVKDLRAWSKKHGPLNVTSLKSTDSALEEAVRTKFGSLEAAAQALRLKYAPRHQRWSNKRVKEEIRKRKKGGRSLQAARVKEENRSLYNAGLRYFGDWASAIRSASR